MTLELFGHPFSSYTWKALIALYEKDLPFTLIKLGPDQEENHARLQALWPVGQFPVLVDGPRTIVEATAVIEYLDAAYPGDPGLIPADRMAAVDVRMRDRIFDNHVMYNMQRVVNDALRKQHRHSAHEVRLAKAALDTIYAWLEGNLGNRWACSDDFTLADCAAAPALFYADWVHRIPDTLPVLKAYRARLLTRPSVARCVEDARPYRHYFPLGAPDRD
jgi:glutathione S-transferase